MPAPKERQTMHVRSERAILAAVRLPDSVFDERDPFGELSSLAEQAGAVVVGTLDQRKPKPEAATFMGAGKVEELRDLCQALEADVVIFDHDLSPRQLANIEKVVGKKILDRSELILDIFAARATTHEAKLQVELAQMQYTYPRLRAMWDHLERITGGGGVGGVGTRGPGEQQLEIDRRLAQKRRMELQNELDGIYARKRRMVQDRKKDHFTVGIVGYTNAGKSTLFNALTAGGAYADDRLFATLVTRTRDWDLSGGFTVMLSDTVGFVRDLPHNLVASFRATLEEATHADILLIVLDVSDPAADLHYDTVCKTLDDLEAEVRETERRDGNLPEQNYDEHGWTPPRRLLLLNKADKLADNRELLVWKQKAGEQDSFVISAIDIQRARERGDPELGLGYAQLRQRVLEIAQQEELEAEIVVPLREGKAVDRLEKRAKVLDREYDETGTAVTMRVRIGRRQLEQLKSTSPGLKVRELGPVAPDTSPRPAK
ncbi:MAG: GTPase HflX [Phycisphaerales bacterium]|nr:GTPase HflX [Phycisphaerales bacterium]